MKKSRPDRQPPAPQLRRVMDICGKHPYWCTLFACLLLCPFCFGGVDYVPRYAPLWAAVLMLSAAVLLFLAGKGTRHDSRTDRAVFSAVHGTNPDCRQQRTRLISLLILSLSFLLKLYYVLYTPITRRQHDVGRFGTDTDHAGYIEYLLCHHQLPDFDPRERWQFYHPPLHHTISALWIGLMEHVFGVAPAAARESLQLLTLFYAMAIVITAYRIFRHFQLKGMALYVPLLLMAFHPAYILFSGSINNDVLSVAFLMGAVLCTLRWYDAPTWRETIKLALCIGLGMMTKLSVGMLAIPVGLVMLVKLVQQLKARQYAICKKLLLFAAVCVPLGLWYPVRNRIRFGVPLNYVAQLEVTNSQYVGDRTLWARMTDFSPGQFDSVFEQFAKNGTYNEFNPLTALLKNALFGEYIREDTLENFAPAIWLARGFFWVGVLLAAAGFAAMAVLLCRKCALPTVKKWFFAVLYLTMIISFYKLAGDYPFVCTMNSRYITPVIFVTALFYGEAIHQLCLSRKKAGHVLAGTMAGLVLLFSAMAAAVYVAVCF